MQPIVIMKKPGYSQITRRRRAQTSDFSVISLEYKGLNQEQERLLQVMLNSPGEAFQTTARCFPSFASDMKTRKVKNDKSYQ